MQCLLLLYHQLLQHYLPKMNQYEFGYIYGGFRDVFPRLFWWLLSIEDVQVRGYFLNALGVKGQDDPKTIKRLSTILSSGDDCPVRKHLINYHDYWNNPNHIGSIDELDDLARGRTYETTGLRVEVKPPNGCATMKPKQPLNDLREQVRNITLGQDITYDWLDDLNDDLNNNLIKSI